MIDIDIDIDMVIPDLTYLEQTIAALASIGYTHRGNLGIFEREAFRREGALINHNLYVCPRESLALKNHLCLRDSLRADEKLRDRYSNLKIELARKFSNLIDDYIEGKTDFILEILKGHGLESDRLEDIRKAGKAQK